MRSLCIVVLSLCILVLAIGHMIQEVQIRNLEQAIKRTEQGYNAVLAENEKLERMSEQCLILMTGGWDEMVSISTGN